MTKEKMNNTKKLISVTVSMPAFNEQHNIDNLLKQIFSQEQDGFFIEKVIVASDGSTDDTVKIVSKYMKWGVEIIEGKENRGQAYRQNEIISKSTSDILVLLNADLVLGNGKILKHLIKPILEGADLSALWAKPLKPMTFIEKLLCAGYDLKHYVYQRHKNGDNIYTCVGHMRALSKNLYSNVKFPPVSDGEDQYLYLLSVKGGYKYKYSGPADLFFKLPDTFSDYKKYAKRIFQTQTKYGKEFSEDLVMAERFLPLSLKIKGCIYAIKRKPIHTPLYVLIHLFVQQWAVRQPKNDSHVFEVSRSTKKISLNNL